jgi:hypothetical protein
MRFHCSSGYTNSPQCYVIHTLSVNAWWKYGISLNTRQLRIRQMGRIRKKYIYFVYIHTYIHTQWNLGSRTPFITNNFSEQKTSRGDEHASRQQRLATSWEYRRESVGCCVAFAQYTTSLLEFVVPSLEFNCFVFFKHIIK